jgi:short-subunit dehydrogenase
MNRRRQLHSARVLITGASSGIGRALALRLAHHQARLLLTARRADRLEQLAREVQVAGGSADVLAGDITDSEHRRQLVDRVTGLWGGLDVLVNNAGIGALGPFASADPHRLRQVMEVNFFAPVELARQILPLLSRGKRPLIVNVGSVLGHRAVPGKVEYCASKFALHGFSDGWRTELSSAGIDVLLVSPSTTSSEFFDQAAGSEAEGARHLGRHAARPEWVARQMVRAMQAGKHEIILSWGGKLLVYLDRLAPSWMDWALGKGGRRREEG